VYLRARQRLRAVIADVSFTRDSVRADSRDDESVRPSVLVCGALTVFVGLGSSLVAAASSASDAAATTSPAGVDETAFRLCEHAAQKSGPVAASTATTVGEIRAFRGGPPSPPGKSLLFPGARADSLGVWCWATRANRSYDRNSYDIYAVGPHGKAYLLGRASGMTPGGAPPFA